MTHTAKQILERVYNKGFNDRCQQEKYADIDNQFVSALSVDQALKEIEAYTNAEIAKLLDRLESTAVYAEYDKAEDDVICGDVVPLDAIQAERAKIKGGEIV